MLPLIQGQAERDAVKDAILKLLQDEASGFQSAITYAVIAGRLDWSLALIPLVDKLVRELMSDITPGRLSLGVCDSGVFVIVTSEDRNVAYKAARKRLAQYRRICCNLSSQCKEVCRWNL